MSYPRQHFERGEFVALVFDEPRVVFYQSREIF